MGDAPDLLTICGMIILAGGPVGLVAAAWERGWIPGTRAWFLRRTVRRVTARWDLDPIREPSRR